MGEYCPKCQTSDERFCEHQIEKTDGKSTFSGGVANLDINKDFNEVLLQLSTLWADLQDGRKKSDDMCETVTKAIEQIQKLQKKEAAKKLGKSGGLKKSEKKPRNSALCDGLDPLRPTREEIEKLAYHNLTLYIAMRTKEAQGLTWTETLQFAVKYLIEENLKLQDQVIEIAELSGKPFVVEKRG